jgi:quercetin dioxygenase-like cupin family protein
VGKILVIRAGHRLSLQHHVEKEETLRMAAGEMWLDLEGDDGSLVRHRMVSGDVMHIAPGRRHRMEAITDCEVIEVSTPELEDVVRHSDDYGRAGT